VHGVHVVHVVLVVLVVLMVLVVHVVNVAHVVQMEHVALPPMYLKPEKAELKRSVVNALTILQKNTWTNMQTDYEN
jgi:hypothetical protein